MRGDCSPKEGHISNVDCSCLYLLLLVKLTYIPVPVCVNGIDKVNDASIYNFNKLAT